MLVTHGGVIMGILSAYGLPRANFYDWMCESGCGYSMRITPGLWMRSHVAEVFETLPRGRKAKARITWWWIWHARLQMRAYGKRKEE